MGILDAPAKPRIYAGNTVGAIGDSITANGTIASADAATSLLNGTPGMVGSRNWLLWACLFSNGRMSYAGLSATGGYTTDDIRTNVTNSSGTPHLANALTARPAFCVVLGGTNDIGNGVAAATTFANLTAIYNALAAAGITPVLCTCPPRSSDVTSLKTNLVRLNTWIARQARRNGWPLVDFYGTLVNPANGDYAATLNGDLVHPSNAGAKAMGQALWNALSPYFPPAVTLLPTAQADNFGLNNGAGVRNNLFLTDTNADGLADGWSVTGAPTLGLAADAPNAKGNVQTITRAAGADGAMNSANNLACAAGHRLRLVTRIACTVEGVANTPKADFRVLSSPSAAFIPFAMTDWDLDIPWSTLALEMVVPAFGSDVGVTYQTRAKNGSATAGSLTRHAQFSLGNLTADGLLA